MENQDYSLEVKQELNSIKSLILSVSQRVQSLEESIEKIEKAQSNISSAQQTDSSQFQPIASNPINQAESPNKSNQSSSQTNNLFIPSTAINTKHFDIESRIQAVPINTENNISPFKKFFSSLSLINLIGAFTVLLAVGMLFKVAVDNAWIGPVFRVLLGYIFGIASIGLGEFCQKKQYKSASIGFIGLGQSVLFLTTWFANQNFHFINWQIAFLTYLFITSLVIAQSLRFYSQAIAILGIFGGFLTPVLAAESGKENFIIIGAYFLILVASIFYICSRTGWRAIKWITFVISYLFLTLWAFSLAFAPETLKATKPDLQIPVYLSFLFAFFILYSGIAFSRLAVKKIKLNPFDTTLIISNNILLLLLSLVALQGQYLTYLGLACITLSFAYTFITNWLIKKEYPYQGNLNLLLTVAVAFLTIAIRLIVPIKFVSIAWAIQAIVLAKLAEKKELSFLNFNYLAILFIVAIRLLIVDDIFSSPIDSISNHYNPLGLPTISGLVSILSYFHCLKKYEANPKFNSFLALFLWAGILCSSMFCFSREFYGLSYSTMSKTIAPTFHIGLLLYIGTGITWLFCKYNLTSQNHGSTEIHNKNQWYQQAKLVLISVFAGFLCLMSFESVFDLIKYSDQEILFSHLISFLLISILLILLFLKQAYMRMSSAIYLANTKSLLSSTIIFAIGIILFMGLIRREVYLFTYSIENRDIYQIVLSVSFALLALSVYIIGLLQRDKAKTWIALSLFLYTGIKVYFVDLANLSQLYRGFSLLLFGAILLCASIFEQRINKKSEEIKISDQ